MPGNVSNIIIIIWVLLFLEYSIQRPTTLNKNTNFFLKQWWVGKRMIVTILVTILENSIS